jgi:hypothetical protein
MRLGHSDAMQIILFCMAQRALRKVVMLAV